MMDSHLHLTNSNDRAGTQSFMWHKARYTFWCWFMDTLF